MFAIVNLINISKNVRVSPRWAPVLACSGAPPPSGRLALPGSRDTAPPACDMQDGWSLAGEFSSRSTPFALDIVAARLLVPLSSRKECRIVAMPDVVVRSERFNFPSITN